MPLSNNVEYHAHAVSLYYLECDFSRPQQALSKKFGNSIISAMSAGKSDYVWSVIEIVDLLKSN